MKINEYSKIPSMEMEDDDFDSRQDNSDDDNESGDSVYEPVADTEQSNSDISETRERKSRIVNKCYNKKVEKKWSPEGTFKLIESIEVFPILWGINSSNCQLSRDMIWREVADRINDDRSVNDCKGKWLNLRKTFYKKLVEYRKGRSDRHDDQMISIKWPFFNALMFFKNQESSTINAVQFSIILVGR